MIAFRGLVRKDFKMARSALVLWIAASFILLALFYGFSKYINEPLAMVGFIVTSLIIQSFFSACLMYYQLQKEGKSQLWLHNPQSSYILVLSKMTVTFICQILSQILLFLQNWFVITFFVNPKIIDNGIVTINDMLLINLAVLTGSIMLMIWVIFYWSIYSSLKKFPILKKVRALIILVLFILYNMTESLLAHVSKKLSLFDQWVIPIKTNFAFLYEKNSGWSMDVMTVKFSVIPIIYYVLLSVILLYVSCRLLNKHVEV
ncbi:MULTISPECIES: hypothetical protein [Bacillus]|uniref:Uncharacterized protein n=2 Tax=Bacillus TaxID=1386 RepID=A0A0M4FHG9_9BACI|nr:MULTISPECIES: hypothetical protein [Bacillus]ALC80504.1 hypothetical protein AM592_02075 [Bacillus gobiensis]MBP1083576.1 hypothetical protein [Bacillus capparidis]MED1094769.1 hypothetical protein [Bacillus capparidis]